MSNNLNYNSYGKLVEGTDFCSGFDTKAENLIENDNTDKVVVFPSNTEWATPRTEEYVLTNENADNV